MDEAHAPKLLGRALRYAGAAVGPIASAGSQFFLSLVLLKLLSPHDFGSFSFLLVASVFSWGLWTALFCAPLPLLLTQGTEERRLAARRCVLVTSLFASGIAFLAFLLLGYALAVPPLASLFFALYSAVALMRWLARSYGYASGHPLRTMSSDLVYSLTLIAGVGLLGWYGKASLNTAYAVLLGSALLALIPFGRDYLAAQFGQISIAATHGYGAIWRRHSGWSLVGVLTTEATANAHTYIVTALHGPAAFAPLAASALMVRPIGVAMNALTEFERAQMARQIGAGRADAAAAARRMFRLVLMLVWAGTAGLVAGLLLFNPRLIFPSHYPLAFLVTGAILWLGVAGMRLVRAPESALLQAAGAFRPLAFASVASAGISVVAVFILLFWFGPLWSIGGILLGEAVFAVVTWVQAHRWQSGRLVPDVQESPAELAAEPQPGLPEAAT